MPEGEYGFGVDVGAGTIETAVAVLPSEETAGQPRAEGGSPWGTLPATFRVDATGRPRLCAPEDAGLGEEVLGTAQLLHRVGDPTPLRLGRWTGTAAALLAALVAQAAAAVAGERDAEPAWTTLAVPPSWGNHRREALTAALAAEGVGPVSLTSAAVAAVRALTADGRLTAAAPVLVLDLGSATLDTAVVRGDDENHLVHAAVPLPPLAWGGRDVDDVVVAHVRDCLDAPGLATADRSAARALLAACVTAREALSTQTVVDVELGPSWTPPSVRLTREELEERLDEAVDAVADAAADAVSAAGLTAAELGAVVLTGGLAAMPLIAERLSAELDAPLVVADEPGRTAACGAALLAAAALVPAAGEDEDAEEGSTAAAPADAAPRRRSRVRTSARRRDGTPERPATAPGGGAHPRGRAGDRAGRPWRLRGGLVAGLFLALVLAPTALLALTGSSTVGALPDRSAAAAGTSGTTEEPPAGGPAGADEQLPAGQVSPAAATAAHRGSRTAPGTTPAAGRSSDGPTAARSATTAPGTTAAGTKVPATPGATASIPAPSGLGSAGDHGTTSSSPSARPPATAPDPPATTPDPPATTPDPPATTPHPPATTPDPPATTPDPPATTPTSTSDTGTGGTGAPSGTASGTPTGTASGTADPAA